MSRIARHLENLRARGVLKATACGRWVRPDDAVDSLDATTCKACRARARSGAALKPGTITARPAGLVAGNEVAHELHLALAAVVPTLAPCASAPPALTPAIWSSSCRSAQHGRCRACALCAWHAEAERWAHASPWGDQPEPHAPDGAPRWRTLDAALRALAAWHLHGRAAIGLRSATGPILDRLQRGQCVSGQSDPTRRLPRAVVAAFDLVDVETRLDRAARRVGGELAPDKLIACLVARVALDEVAPYYDLAARHGVDERAVRAGVRRLRAELAADLVEAGLLAAGGRSRATAGASAMQRQEIAP